MSLEMAIGTGKTSAVHARLIASAVHIEPAERGGKRTSHCRHHAPTPMSTGTASAYVINEPKGFLSITRRSEPGGQRLGESRLRLVSHPGHISVRPNQHGHGRGYGTKCR